MLHEERARTRVEFSPSPVARRGAMAQTEAQAQPSVAAPPRRRRSAWYLPLKTAMDWLAALLLLVLIGAPIIAILALLTKLTSSGPAFYTQVRLGRNGRPFRMHKIRSMQHNCEATTGAIWCKGEADPRVTRIGRIMRETHLDELPQLIHVLQGHMSLIGPRPERPEIVARIERTLPHYRDRLLVKPGLTGLAQVQLPADEDLEDVRRKLAHDLYYVRHIGPGLDLRIAGSTALHLTALCFSACSKLLVRSCRPSPELEHGVNGSAGRQQQDVQQLVSGSGAARQAPAA